MLLYELTDHFHKHKIPFAIVGGYALALQGLIRATMDVDLVLHLKLSDFKKAESCLMELGLKSRLPLRAEEVIQMRLEYIEKRNLLAWSFVDFANPTRQVDLLLTMDLNELETENISVAGRKLRVASLESLLAMKMDSDRPQDQADVQRILEVLNDKEK